MTRLFCVLLTLLLSLSGPAMGANSDFCLSSLAANNTTPLYRAVMNSELDDIVTSGAFRNPVGIEQKYFSATAEGAASYARQAFGKMGDTSPYTIIKTDAPTSLLPSIHSVDRGVPAILVPTNVLPKLGPPQVLPYSPYPH